jgi:hypothetical protein
MWKHFNLHPSGWTAPDGGETVSQYCVPNEPTRQYLYTPAWVNKIVSEIGTVEKFTTFFGYSPPKGKVTPIAAAPSKNDLEASASLAEQEVS